jgi:hypothetical protein
LFDQVATLALPQQPNFALFWFITLAQFETGHCNGPILEMAVNVLIPANRLRRIVRDSFTTAPLSLPKTLSTR